MIRSWPRWAGGLFVDRAAGLCARLRSNRVFYQVPEPKPAGMPGHPREHEHTFRFFKQVLGWDAPLLRDPAAADRWTWLLIACYTQLRLARPLAADLRLPWQRPQPPGGLTPARVRRGFRAVREQAGTPAAPPKPGRPGPGRPKGSKNRHKAPRHDVGKHHPNRQKRTKRPSKTKQPG